MKLYYSYDKEADVLYFSEGKPSGRDISEETPDDVIVRLHPKTRKVRGFTILNFSRRSKSGIPVSLPLEANLQFSRK